MAFRYTQEVMVILIRQFQSPDEEMKKIVLKVKTCDIRIKRYKVSELIRTCILYVHDA